MKTNPLRNTVVLCLSVLLVLGLLSAFPEFSLGSFRFRKVDLLAEVRTSPRDTDSETPTALLTESEVVALKLDSIAKEIQTECKPGITCVEDFSPDSTGLDNFLRALTKLKNKGKPVRIAFYGDSFIEGDVFCGAVRDTLQSIFGGRGVGFVPITSHITGFRNTIRHEFDNWKTYSIVGPVDSSRTIKPGPAGYCFKPKKDNWVEYRVSKQRFLREFSVMKVYYRNPGKATMYYTVNDSSLNTSILKTGSHMREWKHEDPEAKTITYEFEDADSLEVYGASFESREGIFVDNFAMRGNSGIALYDIPDKLLKEFNQYRDYKLIFLQYGLNVIREDSSRYGWYAKKMITVIEKLKRDFPKASIVLLSVSDRSTNSNGNYKTARGIPALRNTQRYIAKETGIVFWDLYEAMGGEDSMVKFVTSKPALAAKDYTHLNFKGGKKLASSLVKSLLFELEEYEKKNALP
jgi:lysophospholipase L1-like esterase